MEFARRLQFRGAVRTSRQMLFYFKTSIVFDLVVNVEHDVVFYPITIHFPNPSPRKSIPVFQFLSRSYLISDSAPRSFCVARNSVFLAVSSVVFNISPTVRNFSP